MMVSRVRATTSNPQVSTSTNRDLEPDVHDNAPDPLTYLMQPPSNETPEEKAKRLKAEAKAAKVRLVHLLEIVIEAGCDERVVIHAAMISTKL